MTEDPEKISARQILCGALQVLRKKGRWIKESYDTEQDEDFRVCAIGAVHRGGGMRYGRLMEGGNRRFEHLPRRALHNAIEKLYPEDMKRLIVEEAAVFGSLVETWNDKFCRSSYKVIRVFVHAARDLDLRESERLSEPD